MNDKNIQDVICTRKNDEKVRNMILKEDFMVTCFLCGKKVSLSSCCYLGGEPVHKRCK